jgi:acid phosphatase
MAPKVIGGPSRTLTVVSAVVCITFIYFLLWNMINGAANVHVEAPHHGSMAEPETQPQPGASQPGEATRPDNIPDGDEWIKPDLGPPAYGTGPSSASWKSWFTPSGWFGGADWAAKKGGSIGVDWNILYHLGGDGPWVEKIQDNFPDATVEPPKGCEVKQVHMLSRHGERYPTTGLGQNMQKVLDKMKKGKPYGDLEFLNTWEHFVTGKCIFIIASGADCLEPEKQLNQLTSTGPYAGTIEAFSTGAKLRSRYPKLISQVLDEDEVLKIWSSDSGRVKESARLLALGMFGASKKTSIEVIPETADRGGNTLTPVETCLKYANDPLIGHDLGNHEMSIWLVIYLRKTADRLEGFLYPDRKAAEDSGEPMIVFSSEDVFTMQELCGFEINVRGQSPWCDVFTKEEWSHFEFARDVYHFFRSGPGNDWGPVLGTPWLNATAKILSSPDPNVQDDPFYLSFTHDTSMVPVATLLGLFDGVPKIQPDSFEERRKFKMTQYLPMGGRITIEKLACGVPGSSETQSYVRLNVNDGITQIPDCEDGPGGTCSVKRFVEVLEKQMAKAGDFKTKCGLADDAPTSIEFLTQE